MSSAIGRPWDDLVGSSLRPEYLRHFHKNFESGDYASMRGLWSSGKLAGPEDLPPTLNGLTYGGEDSVTYRRRSGDGDGGGSEATLETASTLRGVLRARLRPDLALDVFDEVSSLEEGVYSWRVRGPRVLATALLSDDGGGSASPPPDLIALQEYDVHDVPADYRRLGPSSREETFSEAMNLAGYEGAFFKDPLRGRTPPSGIALYWRRGIFAPAPPPANSPSSEGADDATPSAEGLGGGLFKDDPRGGYPAASVLECDESALGGALFNADLRETWHHPSSSLPSDPPRLMPAADRRNAGLARLRHLPTGRTVLACVAHLMTTSRDCAGTNLYPGEVRAGELGAIGDLVASRAEDGDDVLLLGDLNSDAGGDARTVFGGRIGSSVGDGGLDGNGAPPFREVDTGFDAEAGAFRWGPHLLSDTFAEVHRWGEDVGEGKHCTTRNAERIEWVDYLFHGQGLRPVCKSVNRTPMELIPDERNPSDHLPVWATFKFLDESGPRTERTPSKI